MTCPFRRTFINSVTLLSLLLLLSLRFSSSVSAVVTRPQYATVNGTFYIQGGSPDGGNATNAFFSLSLSIPWNDTATPWVDLPDNTSGILAPSLWERTMSLTADNKQLLIWNMNATQSTMYNISSGCWTYKDLPQISNSIVGVTALIDPTSAGLGTFYVPNGCRLQAISVPSATQTGTPGLPTPPFPTTTPAITWTMCKYDMSISNSSVTNVLMISNSSVPDGVLYYSFVHCSARNTFLLYGGIGNNRAANPNLIEFNTTQLSWNLISAKGESPGDINSHCMVQTTDGTRMIVFGGVSTTNVVSSKLYILDVANLTWTAGANAGDGNARYGHACTTYGDNFIVWGGQNLTVMNNTPLIYSIPVNQWVHNYVIPGIPPPLPTTSVESQTPLPGSTNSSATPAFPGKPFGLGGIIGCAVGGVVIISATGFLFYRRHRKAKLEDYDFPPLPELQEEDREHFRVFRKKGLIGWDDDDDDDDEDNNSVYDSDNNGFTDKNAALHQRASRKSHFSPTLLESSSASTLVVHQPPPPSRRKKPKESTTSGYPSVVTVTHQLLRESSAESPEPRRKPMSQSSSFSTASTPSTLNNSIATVVTVSPLPSPSKVTFKKVTETISEPQPSYQVHSKGRGRTTPLITSRSSSPVVPSSRHSPQYVPVGYEGHDIWGNCGQEGVRSPQLHSPGYETSPAAWMAMMNTIHAAKEKPQCLSYHRASSPQAILPVELRNLNSSGCDDSHRGHRPTKPRRKPVWSEIPDQEPKIK